MMVRTCPLIKPQDSAASPRSRDQRSQGVYAMKQDKRFYTFIFAPTANSRFRKINIHYNVLYSILGLALIGFITVGFGAFRLANHAIVVAKLNLAQMENRRLRDKNDEYKQ